jgi:hypothetical protein
MPETPAERQARIQRNVFRIKAQGGTEADVQQYLAEEGGAPLPTPSAGDVLAGALQAPLQGVLPIADETSAVIGTVLDKARGALTGQRAGTWREALDRNLAANRRANDAFREAHRLASPALEAAGAMTAATLAGVPRAVQSVATEAAPAVTRLGRLGQRLTTTGRAAVAGARTAAPYGAAAGIASGDDSVTGRVAGGVVGGALATGLGAGLGAGADLFAKPFSAAFTRFLATPEQRGARFLNTDAQRAGTTLAALREAAERGEFAPGEIVADRLGRGGRSRLDYAVNRGSRGGEQAAEYLEGRKLGRGLRLQRAADQALGVDTRNVVQTRDALEEARSAAAKNNYGAAYQESVPVDVFSEVANVRVPGRGGSVNPFREAYENGRTFAAIDGIALPPWEAIEEALTTPAGQPRALERLPVQGLDYMKRGMDKLVQRGTDATFAIDRGAARSLGNRLRAVLAKGDPHAPNFAKARAEFGASSDAIEALEQGRNVFRADPDQLARDVPAMAPEERTQLRRGTANAIYRDVTGRDLSGETSLQFFQRPLTQDALRPLYPEPSAADRLRAVIGTERRMAQTERVGGGSPTQPRQMTARETESQIPEVMEDVGAVARGFLGNPLPALQRFGSRAYSRVALGINEQTGDEIARLYAAGRGGKDELLRLLAEAQGATTPPPAVRARGIDWLNPLGRPALLRASGAAAGRGGR